MSWQPIETAPKDGTRVDLWLKEPTHSQGWRMTDCEFRKPDKYSYMGFKNPTEPAWCMQDLASGWQPFSSDEHLTHWMLVPEPPNTPQHEDQCVCARCYLRRDQWLNLDRRNLP